LSDKSIKVTDRRMFTADGELREEFRQLETASPAAPAEPARPASPPPAAEPRPADRPAGGILDPGPAAADPNAPGFFDLVGLLAEPASIYLQEAHTADPQTAAQSLEMARLHIDLLALLRTKTEGNLSPSEKVMLDDVVYQLRSSYVGLRG
jgi:Domain of unknown function (DUF1844)